MICEKCGSDNIYTRYHANAHECGYVSRAKRWGLGEHLHRTCRVCEFDWADALAVPSETEAP